QSLNSKTLKSINRTGLSFQQLQRVYSKIKKINFKWTNVDLMIGLDGQTEEEVIDNLQKLISLRINSVTVYVFKQQLQSISSINNKRKFFNNYYDVKIPKIQSKLREVAKELNFFELDMRSNTGQVFVDSSCEDNKEDYRVGDSLPIFIFGLGESAGSQITDQLLYYHDVNGDYSFKPTNKIYKGIPWFLKDSIREYIVSVLHSNGKIDLSKLKTHLDIDLMDFFSDEINVLVKLKKANIKNNILSFNLENKVEKAIYDKFFYDQAIIEKKLNQL
ncbi:hypothetical protein ACFL2U_04010, partial [Patescibacteria group bacterium]